MGKHIKKFLPKVIEKKKEKKMREKSNKRREERKAFLYNIQISRHKVKNKTS